MGTWTKCECTRLIKRVVFPAIAAWGVLILGQTLSAANFATGNPGLAGEVLAKPDAFEMAGMHLDGLVATSQGFMLTCMVWAAASTMLIERQFLKAAVWVAVGALFSLFGFMHAGELTPAGGVYDIGLGAGWEWSVGYLLAGAFFVAMHVWTRRRSRSRQTSGDNI